MELKSNVWRSDVIIIIIIILLLWISLKVTVVRRRFTNLVDKARFEIWKSIVLQCLTMRQLHSNYNYWTMDRVDGSILGQPCRPGTRNSETQKKCSGTVRAGDQWSQLVCRVWSMDTCGWSYRSLVKVWCGYRVLSRWTLLLTFATKIATH